MPDDPAPAGGEPTNAPGGQPAGDPPPSNTPPADPPAGGPPPADPPGDKGGDNPPPTPDTSWRESITDENLRKHAERFNSPTDLVKANLDQHKQISGMVRVPGKEATEEEQAAFRKAIGVPDTVEGYGPIEVPEGLPADLVDESTDQLYSDFTQRMFDAGAPAAAVKAAMDWYFHTEAAVREAMVKADKDYADETDAELRKEWGADWDANRAAGDQFLREFAGSDLETVKGLELNTGRLAMDHPAMRRLIASAGRSLTEGRPHPMSEGEATSVKDEINALMSLKHHPDPVQRAKWRDPGTQDRLMELRRMQVGSEPPVGVGGRTV